MTVFQGSTSHQPPRQVNGVVRRLGPMGVWCKRKRAWIIFVMTEPLSDVPTLFKGRHFNHLLIIQAVRWYITYKLSYRDVCDLMAERGVTVVHTTVMRWVQRYVPVFEKKWKKY